MLLTFKLWPKRNRNVTGSRTPPKPFLDDRQWFRIAHLFAKPKPNPKGGRPPVDPRPCLEGILWVLTTGARWKDLPERYPSPATCWRRFAKWGRNGVFAAAWKLLLGQLDALKKLRWDEAMADGTFAAAKKGVPRSAPPRKERARRS